MTASRLDPVLRRKLDEAWRLLEDNGQTATVRSIRDCLDRDAATTPSVVVVGEAKRGKSSLINALVGAEVAPIGVDIVTGAYVAYIPFAVEHAVAPGTARLAFADGASHDVPMSNSRTGSRSPARMPTAGWSARRHGCTHRLPWT